MTKQVSKIPLKEYPVEIVWLLAVDDLNLAHVARSHVSATRLIEKHSSVLHWGQAGTGHKIKKLK